MMDTFFTIECKNVYLREYRPEDLNELQALTMQPEIHTFLPDWNVPKEQRAEWMKNCEIPENKAFLKGGQGMSSRPQLTTSPWYYSQRNGRLYRLVLHWSKG